MLNRRETVPKRGKPCHRVCVCVRHIVSQCADRNYLKYDMFDKCVRPCQTVSAAVYGT